MHKKGRFRNLTLKILGQILKWIIQYTIKYSIIPSYSSRTPILTSTTVVPDAAPGVYEAASSSQRT